MFQAIRLINKSEDNHNIIVKNTKGETLHSTKEELTEITKYFEEIFKQENTTPLPDIKPQKLEQEKTSEEIRLAVNKIRNNKSPGCDDINAELIKHSPEIVYEHIAQILNNVVETGNKPIKITLD